MLTLKLEEIWRNTPAKERRKATIRAEMALANLVHYPGGPMKRRQYYNADVEMLAAEFVAFKREEPLKDEEV